MLELITLNLNIETVALLFPAISLLFLAYTNRFLATGQLIRSLAASIQTGKVPRLRDQIRNLTRRLEIIRLMQLTGALSLLFCTLSILALFLSFKLTGITLFVISLISMVLSLSFLVYELYISTIAITIELKHMKKTLVKED